jgi:hypothetical protein
MVFGTFPYHGLFTFQLFSASDLLAQTALLARILRETR